MEDELQVTNFSNGKISFFVVILVLMEDELQGHVRGTCAAGLGSRNPCFNGR